MLVYFVALNALHNSNWYLAKGDQLSQGAHHQRHLELFGSDAPEFNKAVLAGVDKVQSSAPTGGGYFIGVHAVPAECPVGYPLQLFSKPILQPTRTTSYCSGSSYSAFIEALNKILGPREKELSDERFEALRMQEPDGGRREDGVKFWGLWNADGPGSYFALVDYAGMGTRINPAEALPGDFMNISWKSGLGHSVVFLGWVSDATGHPGILYWSSQKGTDGFGDQMSPISSVKDVVAVRLTKPEALFSLDVAKKVDLKVQGDPVLFGGS